MTQEELIAKGSRAKLILDNDEIMEYFDEIKGDLTASLTNSMPEQNNERELIYFQIHGINTLLVYLNSYVSMADQILKKAENTEEQIDIFGDNNEGTI